VRTGRHAEAAAHVAAIRTEDVASLSPRLALLAAGLFETALTIPGIDRWPFDLARVQLAYGERLRRTRAPTVSRVHLAAALETLFIPNDWWFRLPRTLHWSPLRHLL